MHNTDVRYLGNIWTRWTKHGSCGRVDSTNKQVTNSRKVGTCGWVDQAIAHHLRTGFRLPLTPNLIIQIYLILHILSHISRNSRLNTTKMCHKIVNPNFYPRSEKHVNKQSTNKLSLNCIIPNALQEKRQESEPDSTTADLDTVNIWRH